MNNIFKRNIGTLTEKEQAILADKKVFIAGCGGLGGFAAEFCVRAGIGNLVLCDMDVFDETNLNRQRFSDIYHLEKSKAETAREKLLDINPSAHVTAYECELNNANARELAAGCDLIIDALDNVKTRFVIEEAAEILNIPLIFGAVSGWCGQVATVMPGEKTVTELYKYTSGEEKPSVIVTTAAVTAGYEVTEAIKVLLGRPSLKGKMLIIDLADNEIDVLKVR